MPFLCIPVLIGSFLFPLRIAIVNSLIGLILTLWIPYHFEFFDSHNRVIFAVLFNITVIVILFIGTQLRVWDDTQMVEDRVHLLRTSKMTTLGQIAGNIAHEINTPIGAISLRAIQLQRLLEKNDLSNKSNLQAFNMVKEIEKTAMDIGTTVATLRMLSKNENSNSLDAVDVTTVIESTLRICRQKLENAGIKVKIKLPIYKLVIRGDDLQIAHILLNLLTNAQQAISHLDNKWIVIEAKDMEQYIEISVTDSGERIPNNIASKIFEPFFTTKDLGKGAGLGLSFSQSSAMRMNGKLYLDQSEACPNTRFVLEMTKHNATT